MSLYFPFLKFKQNEIQCIGTLAEATRVKIRPVFDVPRTKKNQSVEEILERLRLGIEHLAKLRQRIGHFDFYVDNFDIDDDLMPRGVPQYRFILQSLKAFRAIPVLALDRHADHNPAALDYLKDVGGPVAVRLQLDDIDSWTLVKRKLSALWAELAKIGTHPVHLFVDARLVADHAATASAIGEFLKKLRAEFYVEHVVVTGSTIPANVSELVETSQMKSVARREYLLWRALIAQPPLQDVRFGDYGVVSPEFSDIDIDPELFRTISAPRAFYPYADKLFAVRGTSFKSHPLGNGQYFHIADLIESQPFFRGQAYSYGDQYIFDRTLKSLRRPSKAGSPGSWVKSTLASHITYIGNCI